MPKIYCPDCADTCPTCDKCNCFHATPCAPVHRHRLVTTVRSHGAVRICLDCDHAE